MSETRLNTDAALRGPDDPELTPDDPLEIVFAEDVELDETPPVEDCKHALTSEPAASPPVERPGGEALS